jgi:hypothetical protein
VPIDFCLDECRVTVWRPVPRSRDEEYRTLRGGTAVARGRFHAMRWVALD